MLEQAQRIGKLENGLMYYIHNNSIQNNPVINKIRFLLLNKTGSLNDEEQRNGLAHFTEHMCLSHKLLKPEEETLPFPSLINIKDYSFSGYTDFDRTALRIYRNIEVSNLKNDFTILKSIMNGDVFRKEVLNQVKNDILYECKYLKNKIQKSIIEFITDGKIKALPIGTPEVIENLTIEDLTEFYHKNYTFDKGALLIVGDLDVIETEKMILETFNSKKAVVETNDEVKKTVVPYLKNEILALEDIENNYNVVHVYYRLTLQSNTMKKRLIRYFFDRMLEAYIQNQFQFNNIDIIEVGCASKRSIGENDYFIVIYKPITLEETENLYLNMITKLTQTGFKEEEFKEQLDFLKSVLKEIITGKSKTTVEDLCEEYIKHFFDNEAILLIQEDYDEILRNISHIQISDINNLVKYILASYCKIIKVKAAASGDGLTTL